MEVLQTYIYEIRKGTKPLALVTMQKKNLKYAIEKIVKNHLNYFAQVINNDKINLFLGERAPIEVAKTMFSKPLSDLNAQEDFILGILLGYSIKEQCNRFKNRLSKSPVRQC